MQEITFIYKNKLTTKEIKLSTEYIDLPIEDVLNLMRQYIVLLGYNTDIANQLGFDNVDCEPFG